MKTSKNAYQILGIDDWESATAKKIKSAYKIQALIYHPDKNTGKEAGKLYQLSF
jgi:DnaJ-class molecular chaperone